MITFACSGCERTLSVPEDKAGKRARCPACRAATAIPSPPTRGATEAPTLPPAPSLPDAPTMAPPTAIADQPTLGTPGAAAGPGRVPAVPGYEVLGELGRGGMGVVYKARQQRPRRLVALKMVLAGEHAGADALARFRHEAEAVAKLQHPGIVAVHEVGDHDGHPFFSLEYVEGGSLAGLLRDEGWLPAREAAELLLQMARAVDYAHRKGVLHRDLKPGNILLAPADDSEDDEREAPRWRAKIADFGLAKQTDEMASAAPAGPKTASGAVLGTPAYMAPEQAAGKGKEVGPAADVYSLGAILYELLGGRPPFEAGSMLDTLMKVATEDPVPLRQLRPKLPRDLETICHKCLRKAPADRYASAKDLADDLRRFLDGDPIKARPQGGFERLRRRLAKNKALLYVGGSALVAACASLAVLLWLRPAERSEGPRPAPSAPVIESSDLRLVPRRAFAMASARVADLWARPDVARLWQEVLAKEMGGPPAFANLAVVSDNLEKETSLKPADVERLTVVLRSFDESPLARGIGLNQSGGPVLIVRTKQPFDYEKLRAVLGKGWGGLEQSDHKGRALFTSAKKDLRLCLCRVDDHVFVAGITGSVKKLLDDAEQQAPGPLDDALAQADKGAPLVAAFRPPGDMTEALSKSPLFAGKDLAPAKPAQAVTLVLTPQPPAEGRVLPDLDLDVTARFPDDEKARLAPDAARALFGALLGGMETELRRGELWPVLEPTFRAVRAAGWEADGPILRLAVRSRWTDDDRSRVEAFVRERPLYAQSAAKLARIGQALHRYAQANGGLPPAVITSPRGEKLFSWRVAILPYTEHADDYRAVHYGRPWDHPANKALLEKMPPLFAAPGVKEGNKTYYQALVGPDAALDAKDHRPVPQSFPDGTANTLLVVEGGKSVHWAAPGDVAFEKGRRPEVGGLFRDGFLGLLGDGTVHRFLRDIPDEPLGALASRAGGEVVNAWQWTTPIPGWVPPPMKKEGKSGPPSVGKK